MNVPSGLPRRRQREAMKPTIKQLIVLENATFDSDAAREFDLSGLQGHHTNPVWREKVTQWCYDVVDHLNESRSVVYVAMNILDRFTSKQEPGKNISDRNFELASLSALFLSVRIAGSGNLRLPQLLAMSRSSFTTKDLIGMGTRMIKTLSWNHRLVTPLEFVNAICRELPGSIEERTRQNIVDAATYFVEISVCDVSMSTKRASHTAMAAVLNVLNENRNLSLAQFNESVSIVTEHVPESRELMETRIHLRQLFNQTCESRKVSSPHLIMDDDLPTCVSEESLSSLDTEESSVIVPASPTTNKTLKRVATDHENKVFKRRKTDIIQH